ncbi:MAG TPA: hypothetical protein VK430_10305 [Xanthobacteraceae bacterium]|nr:hypothetical protein [Xanthobacteraceae bacterium]
MADSRAHVYLLRGLMNIFSLGMDALAEKIQRHGIYATVHNYAEWQSLADRAAAAYKAGAEGPIIIIGHSLGADAVMEMSAYLGRKGVPVALAVPFDAKQSFATPSNVGHLLNLTHGDYGHMSRGPGFHGTLVNVDVSADRSIDHLNIDKSARLHAQVISAILAVVGGEHRSAEPTAHNHHVPDGVAAPAVGSDGVVKPAESTAAPPKPADGENGATKASEAMKPLADSGTPIIAAPEKGGASSRTP